MGGGIEGEAVSCALVGFSCGRGSVYLLRIPTDERIGHCVFWPMSLYLAERFGR